MRGVDTGGSATHPCGASTVFFQSKRVLAQRLLILAGGAVYFPINDQECLMTERDPAPRTALETENAELTALAPAAGRVCEQNEKICRPATLDPAHFPPGTIIDPDESLPPVWRLRGPNEPANGVYIHGPKGARFAEPPPANPEPPEPEEHVGAELTQRQLAFCDFYVERPVAAIAARAAGYAEATAAKQASRLLKHPLVIRRILELRRKRHLEQACRRETLIDKLELVFAQAIERNEFYAAVQALTMQARLARIQEALPGFRYVGRYENGREQLLWESLTRLEQKLSEIAVGDFPGAAAAVPKQSFADAAVAAAGRIGNFGGDAGAQTGDALDRRRARRK
jgi:hypothetical protein